MKNLIFSLNLFDIDTFVSLLSLEKSRSYRLWPAIGWNPTCVTKKHTMSPAVFYALSLIVYNYYFNRAFSHRPGKLESQTKMFDVPRMGRSKWTREGPLENCGRSAPGYIWTTRAELRRAVALYHKLKRATMCDLTSNVSFEEVSYVETKSRRMFLNLIFIKYYAESRIFLSGT